MWLGRTEEYSENRDERQYEIGRKNFELFFE